MDVQSVLNDYRMVMISRHASLTVRKEVFMGKAKFGVYGDGKELAQVAMAKFLGWEISGQGITETKPCYLPWKS